MSLDILDQLLEDTESSPERLAVGGTLSTGQSAAQWPTLPKQAVAKLNYSHQAMIDLIIASPGISQNQLGMVFGYSASWISQVMSTDAFEAQLAARRKELVDPSLLATVEERLKGTMLRSLEILSEKLASPSSAVPDNLALRTLELSQRALGYGARETSVRVDVNMNAHLNELGDNLTQLLRRKKAEAIEGEFVQLPQGT